MSPNRLVGCLLFALSVFTTPAAKPASADPLPKTYDWTDGSSEPPLNVSQMFSIHDADSELFWAAFIECIHIRGFYSALMSTTEEFPFNSLSKRNIDLISDMRERVAAHESYLQSTGVAVGYAIVQLERLTEKNINLKPGFLTAGITRYLDKEEYIWGMNTSDSGILLQAMLVEELNNCAYYEEQVEESLSE